MVNLVLKKIRTDLTAMLGNDDNAPRVTYPDLSGTEAGIIQPGITLMVVNLEEDSTLRAPDPWHRLNAATNKVQDIYPEMRLYVNLLVIGKIPKSQFESDGEDGSDIVDAYEKTYDYLTRIIRYFQENRVFDTTDNQDNGVQRMTVEFERLDFRKLNEVWNSLRIPYLPSLLYRVGMVILYDNNATDSATVQSIEVNSNTPL